LFGRALFFWGLFGIGGSVVLLGFGRGTEDGLFAFFTLFLLELLQSGSGLESQKNEKENQQQN
jgi:hypothetical protein